MQTTCNLTENGGGEIFLQPEEPDAQWYQIAQIQREVSASWVRDDQGNWRIRLVFVPHQCFQGAPRDERWLKKVEDERQPSWERNVLGSRESVSVWECSICQRRKAFRYQWDEGSGRDCYWFDLEKSPCDSP